jgi:hypothetical protein
MKCSITFLAAALTFAAPSVWAKDDAHADHKPKFGGQVKEVNEIQYELVAKPDIVTVYVEDHGKKLDTKGATGKVTFRHGADRSESVLVPAGGNKLEGKGAFKIAPGTTAIVQVTRAGKAEESVRFTLK